MVPITGWGIDPRGTILGDKDYSILGFSFGAHLHREICLPLGDSEEPVVSID